MGPVNFNGNGDRQPEYWLWGITEDGDSFEVMADIKVTEIPKLVSTTQLSFELVNGAGRKTVSVCRTGKRTVRDKIDQSFCLLKHQVSHTRIPMYLNKYGCWPIVPFVEPTLF